MFQMMGVFAEFERAMIQERVRAGLARAKAEGKQLGRPKGGCLNAREPLIEFAMNAGRAARARERRPRRLIAAAAGNDDRMLAIFLVVRS
jgi:DNA invertase Pin-like site-specific DNA recombinase